VTSDATSGLLE